MENYILAFLGIAVSILLFVLSYRQTVGARKERVAAANTDIEKTIVRRIVMEGYIPEAAELKHLVEAKARDYKINAQDMLSESQILNSAFLRIVESDFMSSEKRVELMHRIIPIILSTEKAEERRLPDIDATDIAKARVARNLTLTLLGVVSSVLGSFLTFFSGRASGAIFQLPIITFVVSMATITIAYLIYRQRDLGDTSSRSHHMERAQKLEREVFRIIGESRHSMYMPPPHNEAYDFSIMKEGKKLLIEAKQWTGPVPLAVLRHVITRLQHEVVAANAESGIVVTRGDIQVQKDLLHEKQVAVMTVKEFRRFMASNQL